MSHRLAHHRLAESLDAQGHMSRAVVDGPERRRLHAPADTRTAWVLAPGADGALREVGVFERLRAQSGTAAAREALELVGHLPHGGLVVVRRGHVPGTRTLAAWFSHHGDEWHGVVAAHAPDIDEIVAPDHVMTGVHCLARMRTALDDAGWPEHGTPERAAAVHDVVAHLDGASRQRAAQDIGHGPAQTGDPDRLVALALAGLAPPEEAEAAAEDVAAEDAAA